MFKQHKTFNLYKKKQPKRRDTYYQSKKCKLLKYIIPPMFITFFMFLIIINVDFDKEIYHTIPRNQELEFLNNTDSNKQLQKESKQFNSELEETKVRNDTQGVIKMQYKTNQIWNHSFALWNARLSDQQNPTTTEKFNSFLSAAIKCTAYTENCTLTCVDGSVSYIDENLEQLQQKCYKKDLSLMLSQCEFYGGILKKTFFGGYFKLMFLSIDNCNLQSIQDGAFTHANVKNLEKLIMINNQLLILQASNLEGLINLKHFEFRQMPLKNEFKQTAILQTISSTVLDVIIQPAINSTFVMDPLIWWQDLYDIPTTYLDLSNTNFKNILNDKSFQPFKALQKLILFNCNLFTFATNTFEAVVNTLEYLDLRFNHLTNLDVHFFELMASRNVDLQVGLNEWFCECDYNLFEIFIKHEHNVQFWDEIICLEPENYKQLNLKQLFIECAVWTTANISDTISTELPTTKGTTDSNTTPFTDSTAATATATLETSTFDTTLTDIIVTTDSITKPRLDSSTTATTTTTTTTTATTPIYPQEEFAKIKCFTDATKTKSVSHYIIKQMFNFSIYTNTKTSVRLKINVKENLEKFYILYFTNYRDQRYINSSQEISMQPHITITISPGSQPYLYCLIRQYSNIISPYDCQAHITENVLKPTVWLFHRDKAWFFTITIIATLVMFLFSLFLVYCLMRLKSVKKHILQNHHKCNEILLVTDKTIKLGFSNNVSSSPISQRSSNYLTPLPTLQASSCCNNGKSLYTSQHTVPLRMAPSSPTTSCKQKAFCGNRNLNRDRLLPRSCQVHMNKLETLSINSDAIYQTIDHYEAVNF